MKRLLPVERLALHVGGWGLLAVLAFFFHIVAFTTVLVVAVDRFLMLRFVYENSKMHKLKEPNESTNEVTDFPSEPTFPELGPDWAGRVRENVSESKG
jgi:hypothetical protein